MAASGWEAEWRLCRQILDHPTGQATFVVLPSRSCGLCGSEFNAFSQTFEDSRSFSQKVPFVVRLEMNRNSVPAREIDQSNTFPIYS
jgi:hypothetical protein